MMVILKRYWIQLTADRRKFGALCAMVAFGLLLWARLIVMSNMPRTAIAEPDDPDLATTAATDERPVTTAPSRPRPAPVEVALDAAVREDPFAISPIHFPKPTPVTDLTGEADKSDAQAVEDPHQIEVRLRALVDGHTLDAAMSSNGLAVIDGRTVRLGELLPGPDDESVRFRLVEVRTRSVILAHRDYRFELNMDAPGG
jgi:hypothetical protein